MCERIDTCAVWGNLMRVFDLKSRIWHLLAGCRRDAKHGEPAMAHLGPGIECHDGKHFAFLGGTAYSAGASHRTVLQKPVLKFDSIKWVLN